MCWEKACCPRNSATKLSREDRFSVEIMAYPPGFRHAKISARKLSTLIKCSMTWLEITMSTLSSRKGNFVLRSAKITYKPLLFASLAASERISIPYISYVCTLFEILLCQTPPPHPRSKTAALGLLSRRRIIASYVRAYICL